MWTGCGALLGLLYSLVETAKICGAEPKTYLLKATYAALEQPGAVTFPNC